MIFPRYIINVITKTTFINNVNVLERYANSLLELQVLMFSRLQMILDSHNLLYLLFVIRIEGKHLVFQDNGALEMTNEAHFMENEAN